jgi:hypothetical protein
MCDYLWAGAYSPAITIAAALIRNSCRNCHSSNFGLTNDKTVFEFTTGHPDKVHKRLKSEGKTALDHKANY